MSASVDTAADSLRDRQLATLTGPQARPALLVVDVQRSFADPEHLTSYGLSDSESAALSDAVERCSDLVDAARAAGVDVVWIELESAPDALWRASSWLHTGDPDKPLADAPCITGTPGAEWYRLAPAPGEARIVKRGYSGFVGTPLLETLRDRGVSWVSVVGLTTECCVAATAIDAFQREYPVVVASDATAAYSASMHDSALDTLALNAALILTADELAALWTRTEITA